MLDFLSWREGYRLSLAGVTGIIVSIGITADSFIVYFERIRDELREGKSLEGAVETGWRRARRTVLASDAVNLLAAAVLFVLAVGDVQGFALTLGLSTLIDVLVVTLFTHPILQLLARRPFFAEGHAFSGLDPRALGAVYRGRGQFREPAIAGRGAVRGGGRGPAAADDRRAEGRRAGRRREGTRLMAGGLTRFGNDLYTGARSIDFIKRRRIWYLVSGTAVVLALVLPLLVLPIFGRGFHFGIEFTGGSQFTISGSSKVHGPEARTSGGAVRHRTEVEPHDRDRRWRPAPRADHAARPEGRHRESRRGRRRRSRRRTACRTRRRRRPASRRRSSARPGARTSPSGAIRGLIIFLVLVAIVMAVYFRTWKMSVAGIVSLIHDLIITAGVYGIVGFEITPAAVIGFLTILGYSLYDTVVVFDKIRENTSRMGDRSTRTFAETVNLAVNQTLVRSINTSVVGLLPIASILFIGTTLLGAGTLRDISLALFIGIIVGTYSTIFVAAPLYTDLRGDRAGDQAAGAPGADREGARLSQREVPAWPGVSLHEAGGGE